MLAVSALGSIDTPPPSTSAMACTAQIGQAAGHAPTGTSAWQGAGGNGGPQPARPTVVPGPQPRNRAGSGPSHPQRVAAVTSAQTGPSTRVRRPGHQAQVSSPTTRPR